MNRKENLAYLAGIIDGEGSIGLTFRNRSPHPSPTLSVDSTDRELLDWLQDTWGGCIVTKKKQQNHHLQAWTWRLSYRAAIILLRQVFPYLRINRKRIRARLIFEDYVACTPRNGKYTEGQLQEKHDLLVRFRAT